jgi:DNA polymerase III subunit gamma/tau
MAKRKAAATVADAPDSSLPQAEYTVVARRYRPQQFADLIGQEPVARSLVNAIQSGRIAHAYLFTGLRGVGKTSAARILAKALNCEKGPTATPCDHCESCLAITAGQDVDVLEIDGASTNGVDHIRDLRQNVQFRPSRSRFKIYIIDEVHMLSTAAFNALLKTLEEPPPHVKFIFATTTVEKVPLTVLSRCQRFDFASIASERIFDRLRAVVAGEGMAADDDALELIARRAGGSMRDAQSLLEQLLAFGGERLTTEHVHKLLGTAPDDVIASIAAAIIGKDSARALSQLHAGLGRGLQPGELLDQLIEYWRDLMFVNGAGADVAGLNASARLREVITSQAPSIPLDTILAGLDILQATRSRFRAGSHARVLLEMALIRLSRLENLLSLSQIAQMLQGADGPVSAPPTSALRTSIPEPAKKKPTADPNESGHVALTADALPQVWAEVLTQMGPFLGRELEKAGLPAISGPNRLVLQFPPEYNRQSEFCSDPARLNRVLDAIERLTGQSWDLRVELAPGRNGHARPGAATLAPLLPAEQHPLVKSAIELLGAKLLKVDDGFGQPVAGDDGNAAPEPEVEEQ